MFDLLHTYVKKISEFDQTILSPLTDVPRPRLGHRVCPGATAIVFRHGTGAEGPYFEVRIMMLPSLDMVYLNGNYS